MYRPGSAFGSQLCNSRFPISSCGNVNNKTRRETRHTAADSGSEKTRAKSEYLRRCGAGRGRFALPWCEIRPRARSQWRQLTVHRLASAARLHAPTRCGLVTPPYFQLC
ncbi:unnamed protein product [Pieris brassicae]|uniref:Uncharacterized protein n=1 Tax=Pieris brassicae TaxID=7116 RepID=A0A9P0THN6_PIEBR|nr:unnamed protein product [Pieris brassicae]